MPPVCPPVGARVRPRRRDGQMKRKQFSEEQIIGILKEAEAGAVVTDLCRLHILVRRDGIAINRKKTQRLYREEGLTVRRRKGRKRAVGARAPAPVLALPNQRWSLDFVHDQMVTGRRFRILNIVADVTRECLRAVLDTSISGTSSSSTNWRPAIPRPALRSARRTTNRGRRDTAAIGWPTARSPVRRHRRCSLNLV